MAVSVSECAVCHVRTMPDGSLQDGAPANDPFDALVGELVSAGVQKFFKGETSAMANWRSYAVPWIPDDIHNGLKTMPEEELGQLLASNIPGTFPRFNGSPYYTMKIPDLIGVGERKYLDATATHRRRDSEDNLALKTRKGTGL
jgi:hypothetical protein